MQLSNCKDCNIFESAEYHLLLTIIHAAVYCLSESKISLAPSANNESDWFILVSYLPEQFLLPYTISNDSLAANLDTFVCFVSDAF